MHARLMIMKLGPGMRGFAQEMADEAYKMSRDLPGFVSATYLIFNEAAGDYGSLSVWKSAADANGAAEKLTPWLQQKAGGKLKAPPAISVAEVYEPS